MNLQLINNAVFIKIAESPLEIIRLQIPISISIKQIKRLVQRLFVQ